MDEQDLLNAVPGELLQAAYSDGVSDTLKEVGKIGVDFAKTARLLLFPVQFGAMLQDRLARHLRNAIDRVPVEARIPPVESLALQIGEKLRYEEDGTAVAEMYVNLLSRAMDKERVSDAHPAFVQIVGQLAPDEALLLQQLSERDPSAYIRRKAIDDVLLQDDRDEAVNKAHCSDESKQLLKTLFVRPEELQQPFLLYTYIEHLVSLGLVSYTNDHQWASTYGAVKTAMKETDFWFIRLNGFGKLFHRACLNGGDIDPQKADA
ncbi:DUF4393 domain-containing protein [Paraburkholderia sp. IW21]|uniref:DUF4393 domain-containing protein n=1 Tax=Paraburkholderia sp. IW21 TaxID=3242488 RepID=UPI003521C7F3